MKQLKTIEKVFIATMFVIITVLGLLAMNAKDPINAVWILPCMVIAIAGIFVLASNLDYARALKESVKDYNQIRTQLLVTKVNNSDTVKSTMICVCQSGRKSPWDEACMVCKHYDPHVQNTECEHFGCKPIAECYHG